MTLNMDQCQADIVDIIIDGSFAFGSSRSSQLAGKVMKHFHTFTAASHV